MKPDEKIVKYALELNGIDFDGMSEEEQAKISNTFKWLQSYVNGWQNKREDTECSHDWVKPYINNEIKQCRKCGLYERRG